MTLHKPFCISSRLLPSLKIADGWVSLEHVGCSHDGRDVYRWYIDIPAGEFSEADLKSGCGGGATTQKMFGSLLAFLSAAAEAYSYTPRTGRESDNAELFSPAVMEWAHRHDDEIAVLQCDIEERGVVLIEDD